MFKYIKTLPFLYRVWKMYRKMPEEQKIQMQLQGNEIARREIEKRKANLKT